MGSRIRRFFWFAAGMAVLTGADQWTKALAVSALKGQEPFVLWPGVFEFLYSENRGAAFGMLQGQQGFFLAVAVCVLAAAVYVLWKAPSGRRYLPLEICLTMICAGAAGNLADRLTLGYVVDFLYFKWIDFPIFNVADCYVTVGTFVLMFLLLRVYSEEELAVFALGRRERP